MCTCGCDENPSQITSKNWLQLVGATGDQIRISNILVSLSSVINSTLHHPHSTAPTPPAGRELRTPSCATSNLRTVPSSYCHCWCIDFRTLVEAIKKFCLRISSSSKMVVTFHFITSFVSDSDIRQLCCGIAKRELIVFLVPMMTIVNEKSVCDLCVFMCGGTMHNMVAKKLCWSVLGMFWSAK